MESALNQTYGDREVIVVDDGSSDDSIQILDGYGDRIRLFVNDPNIGTYPTLNRALTLASGEYVAVLNSDDAWLPQKLEKQVALMDSNPQMTFCHTSGWFIDADGSELSGAPMGFPFPRTDQGNILHTFVANNSAIASSVLMRASASNQVGGFDGNFRNLGDWDMWLGLAELGEVGFLDDKLTKYRIHGSNTIYSTATTREEELVIRTKHRARERELLAKASNRPAMRRALSHSLACLGSLYSIRGDAREARVCFVESVRLNPRRAKSVLRYLLTYAPLSVRKRLL